MIFPTESAWPRMSPRPFPPLLFSSLPLLSLHHQINFSAPLFTLFLLHRRRWRPGARDEEGGGPDAGRGPRRPVDPSSERQVIRWERFLRRRSLRVLLVEDDDSTRHIVAALLRKCSHHVAVVADGLKGWEVLKEKHHSFHLVLTEASMPFCFRESGFLPKL